MSSATPSTKPVRVPKHRASRACERCRARKVRCDIVHKLDRCTNCTLDDCDCVEVVPRRRKRGTGRHPKTQTQPSFAYATPSEEPSGTSPTKTTDTPRALPPTAAAEQPATDFSETDAESLQEIIQQNDAHPLPDSNEDLFPDFTTDLLKNGRGTGPVAPGLERTSVKAPPDTSEQLLPRNWQKSLPPFVAPIRSQRTFRYHEFLRTQRAFEIPPPRLRDALLMRYFEFVHPQLPLVNFHQVLQAVASNGTQGKVSLLLFQAIMLAGSSVVDAQYIFQAGYPCRMAMRREFTERLRLLYDFDCETDRLILIQCLILATTWQDKGDEVKHLRHWISIAYNIALLLGLNKDTSALSMPIKQKHLRKRIWWSLYMRDRTLSLGLRQMPVIASEMCELPDLEMEDFDIQPATSEACALLKDCGLLRDLDQQKRLAEVFLAQLNLSHHPAEILKSRYTAVAPKLGTTRLIALVLVPKSTNIDTSDVQHCSERLDQWRRDLPEHLRFQTPLSLQFNPGQDVLIFHCGILNLFYYALVCALHRPYPAPILRNLSVSELSSQRKARHAANAVSSILEEFQVLDLIGFLPTQGITFMLQAAVTHLGDSTSKIPHLRSQSHKHVEACLEILNTLKDVHSYAPYATNFLASAAANLYRQSRAIERSNAVVETCNPQLEPEDHDHGSFAETSPALGSTRLATDHWATLTGPRDGIQTIPDFNSAEESLDGLDYPHWVDPYIDYEYMNPNPGWEFFDDITEATI